MKMLYSILIFLCLFILSCREDSKNNQHADNLITQPVLDKQDYMDWCKKKGGSLKKTKELEDITFSLNYKPAELIACIEEVTDKAKPDDLEKNIDELDGLDYYDFKIQITSGMGELLKYQVASSSDYDNRVTYCAFGIEKDIKMVEGNDTISCALFHFERAYDVVPYATFLVAFPKSKTPFAERTFIYEDKIFNKGIIKFTYTQEDLSQIPKMKTI